MNTAICSVTRRVPLGAAAVIFVLTGVSGALAGGKGGGGTDPPPVTRPVVNISPLPLFLGGVLDPNFMLTIDDSESMEWGFFPDSVDLADSGRANPWGLASRRNVLAYDPRVTYTPPANALGTPLANATFGAARADGYQAAVGRTGSADAGGCVVNLASAYRATWTTENPCADSTDPAVFHTESAVGQAAFYYVYFEDAGVAAPGGCDPASVTAETTSACYIRRTLTTTAEQQNFANWYSYYRTRLLAIKGALGSALGSLSTTARAGLGRVNEGGTVVLPIRTMEGSDRTALFNELYATAVDAAGDTALRRAADEIGQYFTTEQPWRSNPSDTNSSPLSCRQSYHFLVSDGVWDGDGASSDASGNADGSAGAPFSDGHTGTLADVAWYYWKTPVRNDGNDVPPNANDPATWQHLVTFALGLGLEDGTIDPDAAFAAIETKTTIPWPDPVGSDSAKVDDFLHAAVNGHGGFSNLAHPFDLASVLSNVVRASAGGGVSSASVVLNSGALRDDTRLYQVRFRSELGTVAVPNPSSWTGQLLAYEINSDGSVGDVLWDAATLVPAAGSRVIATRAGGAARAFTASNAGTIGIPANLIDYVRGVAPGVGSVPSTWRARSTRLGDVVNSAPAYVGPPTAPYLPTWCIDVTNQGDCVVAPEDAAPYPEFRQANLERNPVIYLGSNDGMLHAFDADSGQELFAYVPSPLLQRLTSLTGQPLNHRYFVDGSPTVGDAYFDDGDDEWHTVLVGGLNGGGQGIYALDVTCPPNSDHLYCQGRKFTNESGLVSKVRWEFTDAQDADLGFTYSRPNIVRLNNGEWGVILGNGFNNTFTDTIDTTASTTGNAVLYVVDIESGSLIKKIDTGVGSAQDPTGTGNRPNGLASVAPVDVDGDFVVDYVYAGDLFGNLWKFDLTSTNTNGWAVSGPSSGPLFSAPTTSVCGSTKGQAITTRPQVVRHPEGGQLVLFGTGSYFLVGEASADCQATQAFYGIWDSYGNQSPRFAASAKVQLTDLQQQTIDDVVTTDGVDYRVTSDASFVWRSGAVPSGKLGWYMNLRQAGSTNNYGERQVSDSLVRGGRVIFTTLLPQTDVCDFGGDGWLMELDALSGARPSFSPFYVFRNGLYELVFVMGDHDSNPSTPDAATPPSGRKSQVGIVPTPAILSRSSGEREYKYMSGSTGAIEAVVENPGPIEFGRRSWQQLFKD